MKRINDLNCFHAIMMMRPQPFILQYRISVFICLVNKKIWMDTKTNGTFYFEAEANLTDADADGMPDCYSIESLMNDYYGFGLNHRVDMFCVSDSISYDTVCDYTFVNGIDGIFKKEYNFSDLDRKKCANAFIRYLNTNYHQSIEEGSLD